MDVADAERKVEEMLASDSPPTQALGETTDYRQVILAWTKAHNLGFDEMISRLEAAGTPDAQRLLDEMRRDPQIEQILREGLNEPLSGDTPLAEGEPLPG